MKLFTSLIFGALLAGSSFAASISWSASTIYDPTYEGYTVYLIQYVGTNSITIDNVVSDVKFSGLSGLSSTDYTTHDSAKIAVTGMGEYAAEGVVSTFTTENETQSNFFVILAIDENTYYMSTTLESATTYAESGTPEVENTLGFSSWQVVSVPEPTVLALLALGIAGVALKRRA